MFLIALEQTADLPDAEDIERWLGEPIKCLVVPTHLIIHVHDQQERISRSSQVAPRSHPSIFASKDANSHHWSSASSTLQVLPVVHGTHVASKWKISNAFINITLRSVIGWL